MKKALFGPCLLALMAVSSVSAAETAGDTPCYEMRTYTAAPNRLDALNARFRDHTLKLFERHGIANIGYWTPMKDQKGTDNTLIYLLSHKGTEAAAASFGTFGQDPDWVAARKASEEQAGGSLTIPNGVQSQFLRATDYSPLR